MFGGDGTAHVYGPVNGEEKEDVHVHRVSNFIEMIGSPSWTLGGAATNTISDSVSDHLVDCDGVRKCKLK